MRYRITIRGKAPISIELRGYYDVDTLTELGEFANDWIGYGTVIASPAEDDYDPFKAVPESVNVQDVIDTVTRVQGVIDSIARAADTREAIDGHAFLMEVRRILHDAGVVPPEDRHV